VTAKGSATGADAPPADVARTAGRGGMAVLAAKAFFIATGLAQQTILPGAIGLAAYGALSRVMAVANVVNNVVVSTSTQLVSRTVARAPGREDEALRAALRVHAPLALGFAALFALGAPLVAAFEHAAHITQPLRVLGLVVLFYGLYAPLVGSLNGRKRFTMQAGLDIAFAAMRTVGLLGLGLAFARRGLDGALGAAAGFALAAGCIVPIALKWTGTGRAPGVPSDVVPAPRAYVAQLVPLALAQLATNLLMQTDITLLGRFVSIGALESGLAGDTATKTADEWVGVYRACQLFAFLPYQLLFSVTQVLFPMVASAHADGDRARVADLVRRGSRLALVVCGLFVVVVVTLPGSLLGMLPHGDVLAARGAATLRVLALGQAAFALLGVANTVLISLGKERRAAAITSVAFGVVAAGCWMLVPSAGFGEPQLRTTAAATAAALVLALLGGFVAVRAEAGAFIPIATVARVGVALAMGVAAGAYLPRFGRIATPLVGGAVALAYVGFLVATRELGASDARNIRAMLGRRAK
jgi:stage V sporulation protein B